MSKTYGTDWCNHDVDCKKTDSFGLPAPKQGTNGTCDLRKNKCVPAVASAAGGKKKAPAKAPKKKAPVGKAKK